MRYRRLDENGDYVFGRGAETFLVDSPECVAQAIQTALQLFLGEYFLDTTKGVGWLTSVVGTKNPAEIYNQICIAAIQGVQAVTNIISFSSTLDTETRALSYSVRVDTLYSELNLNGSINLTGYGIGPYSGRPYSN